MPLNYEPGAGRESAGVAFDSTQRAGDVGARVRNLGLTERQRLLNWRYTWYTTNQYDARKVDYDGREYQDPVNREALITGSFIPPGFYAAAQEYPIKYRRPEAPYHLARVIVDKFTELLFGEGRCPRVRVLGDAKTEDYVQALVEETDYWGRWLHARKLGGAMGTVAVGFSFTDGEPRVEVHDPRWCFPDFIDRATLELRSLEKRWVYTREERVPDGKGKWKWDAVPYWYRRLITTTQDIIFKPVRVVDGDEPLWEVDTELSVEHGLGFCPVVWVQNHEVLDDIDGEPDCMGVYDQIEEMDLLQSTGFRGIRLNGDPTVVIKTQAPLTEIAKGSDNTVKLNPGDEFAYVEISATGPKAALEAAGQLKEQIKEVAQVYLPPADGGAVPQTATQVERTQGGMLTRAGLLRKQYGRGALKLLKNMLRAIQRMAAGTTDETGMRVRKVVKLPPRVEEKDGKVTITKRELGGGGHLRLLWPRFVEYTLEDVSKATTAAAEAKEKGLIDQRHATEFVAEMYKVTNVADMLAGMKKEAEEAAAAEQAQFGGGDMPLGGEEYYEQQ